MYSYNKTLTASLSLNEQKNFKEIDGKDGDTVANIYTFNIRSAKDLKSYLDLLEIDINGEISSPYTIYKLLLFFSVKMLYLKLESVTIKIWKLNP